MLRKRDGNGELRPVSGHLDSPTLPELRPEIVPDNLRAAAALYYAATLDELGLFAVADEVTRQIVERELPATSSGLPAAFWRTREERPSGGERAAACARVVGCGAAPDDPGNNREVPLLLGRWLQAVAADPQDPDLADAHARALAGNLSRRSSPQVQQIHAHLGAAIELLSSPEVLQAHDARNLWQVVDHVGRERLQRDVDVVKLRARAVAGTAALEWLADHAAATEFTPDEGLAHIAASWVAL